MITMSRGIIILILIITEYASAILKIQAMEQLPAPYDLYTTNDGYSITSCRRPLFCGLKHMASYTRHTHNEATLERRTTESDSYSHIRQPDCIIIFEEMPLETKKNSIKAYEDFLAHASN